MLIKIYFSLQLPFASDIVDFVGIHHQRTVPVYDIYEKSIRFRTPKHYYSSEKSVMEKKKKKTPWCSILSHTLTQTIPLLR